MPTAYNWAGNQVALSFDQLVRDRLHFKSDYLIDLFGTLLKGTKTPIYSKEMTEEKIQTEEKQPLAVKRPELPFSLKKRALCSPRQMNNFSSTKLQNLSRGEELFKRFKRMKTIYGHANLGEQPMSISCIEFDLSNKYIITGADDRLIKVWLLSNGSLQGVLHGHTDVIMDLHVSYCNRYLISAGKEGVIHIWDFKNLKHL